MGKRLPPGIYVSIDDHAWRNYVERAPLNSRAWVVQERVLARRTVHFACDQMWWSCKTLPTSCEQMPTGAYFSKDINSLTSALMLSSSTNKSVGWHSTWVEVVRKYTSAEITYASDRSIAIDGIAEAVARVYAIPADHYLAGIWRQHIVASFLWFALAWRTSGPTDCSRASDTPTWSWLSVNFPVVIEHESPRVLAKIQLVKIVDAYTQPVGSPFEPVCGGQVTLRGPLVSIHRSTDQKDIGETKLL